MDTSKWNFDLIIKFLGILFLILSLAFFLALILVLFFIIYGDKRGNLPVYMIFQVLSIVLIYASYCFYQKRDWARKFFYVITYLYLIFAVSSFILSLIYIDLRYIRIYEYILIFFVIIIKILPPLAIIFLLSRKKMKEEFK